MYVWQYSDTNHKKRSDEQNEQKDQQVSPGSDGHGIFLSRVMPGRYLLSEYVSDKSVEEGGSSEDAFFCWLKRRGIGLSGA